MAFGPSRPADPAEIGEFRLVDLTAKQVSDTACQPPRKWHDPLQLRSAERGRRASTLMIMSQFRVRLLSKLPHPLVELSLSRLEFVLRGQSRPS